MLHIVFEDDAVVVVNKASGVLSQPGKTTDGSVVTQVRHTLADARGPLLVHRLDMDTSGLIILGKTRVAHRHLQQQFEHRKIHKRYTALLPERPKSLGGVINLPLARDWEHRPKQKVDFTSGKNALTVWHVAKVAEVVKATPTAAVPRSPHTKCRVFLYPQTGRTHQLRVHMAQGLGLPIVGDRLYGKKDVRLMLHADRLQFIHPLTEQPVTVSVKASF